MVLGKVLLRDLDRQLWRIGHREILNPEHSMSKIRGLQAQSISPSVGMHKCTSVVLARHCGLAALRYGSGGMGEAWEIMYSPFSLVTLRTLGDGCAGTKALK